MKKIIIIFLIAFSINVNAQTIRTFQLSGGESFAFTPDKKKHTIGGVVLGLSIFWPTYLQTKNENFAFRKSTLYTIVGSACWEVGNTIAYGKPISFPDMIYTDASGILTGLLMKEVVKSIKKIKANKIKEKFGVSFLPDLKNEPLIKS